MSEIFGVGLLPDGRAVRVLPMDARRMLELTKRVGKLFPPSKPGEAQQLPNQMEFAVETQKATIDMCVRGITLEPIKLVMMRVPDPSFKPTPENEEAPMVEVVDVGASLKPYADKAAPEFKRWTDVGEMQLANDVPENRLSKFVLFADPAAWKAVLERIAAAGGGGGIIDPFAGKMLKTSAG